GAGRRDPPGDRGPGRAPRRLRRERHRRGLGRGPMSEKDPAPDGVQPIIAVGFKRQPFRDIYHRFLRLSWPAALGVIVVVFLVLNAGFAGLYLLTGGIANARPGSFADA